MYKGFKVKIYPNEEQKEKLFQFFGAYRFAYNWTISTEETNIFPSDVIANGTLSICNLSAIANISSLSVISSYLMFLSSKSFFTALQVGQPVEYNFNIFLFFLGAVKLCTSTAILQGSKTLYN